MYRVLLIDDDESLCEVVSHQLRGMGYETETAASAGKGIALFKANRPDVVLTDLQMPDVTGMEVLKQVRALDRDAVVIVITAYGTVEDAVEACKLGADDFLTKPFGKEMLAFVLKKALTLHKLQEENRELRQAVTERSGFQNAVAHSPAMRQAVETARTAADSDATILLLGESGTGKEVLARAIHLASRRSGGSFVAVNCPSIPENLLESELFGHVKGAFTGALRDRKGKFHLARGGTIFLDEIGDLREDLQAKLLRVLQEREYEPVGAERTYPTDARVIAATNKDLKTAMEAGHFRADLYYRISVVPIQVPPLRERPQDIPFLTRHFIQKYAGDRQVEVDEAVWQRLAAYSWPGNVRELENVVERMLVLSPGKKRITPADLPPELISSTPGSHAAAQPPTTLAEAERKAIERALARAQGNRSEAARVLSVPRHVLLYRMKKLGIM